MRLTLLLCLLCCCEPAPVSEPPSEPDDIDDGDRPAPTCGDCHGR